MTHEQVDLKFDVAIKANVDLLREVAPPGNGLSNNKNTPE
jgi:hypothetical protein